MTLIKVLLWVLCAVVIVHSAPDDLRSFHISVLAGWQFQCSNTTCSPFNTVIVSSVRKCQMACLAQIQCRIANYYQSTSLCELFVQALNQNSNMSLNADAVAMIVMTETRIPPCKYGYKILFLKKYF
jgi:hypothetical protein